ncbi:hypothetical protein RI065_06370 [Mycoplasmatota bacterium zrk1]
MHSILKTVKDIHIVTTKFDKKLFGMIIKRVKVNSKEKLEFEMKDGMIIPWEIFK